jgi:pimeloyl-ACP methyl ester carboxylesterase
MPAQALAPSPSLRLLAVEPLRALIEFAGMQLMDSADLPQGDGHPVVIFPGLATDFRATRPLATFCERLGYATYDWGRGLNTGPQGRLDAWIDDLTRHVEALTAHHHDAVSLVGWSLGGLYAREVAKRMGKRVRQVITLGTPLSASTDPTNAAWLYRLLNGESAEVSEAIAAGMRAAPRAPTTAIFSRSDGVVAWQACIQHGNEDHTENIEVDSSHCGLAWNAEVMAILADRLKPRTGRWQRHARGLVGAQFDAPADAGLVATC